MHAHAHRNMYIIVESHHIMNMHDQFMGVNTISLPFPSCFYALAIPVPLYISITCLHCFFFHITTVINVMCTVNPEIFPVYIG